MRNARNIGAIAGIIGGFMTLAGVSSADQLPWPPGSLPQPPRPLSELTAEWWQWAYSIPQPYAIIPGGASYTNQAPFNPLLDLTGASCMAGQRGSVWFLAGTPGNIGSATVTRSCAVPAGVSIFFPVIAFSNINTPGCPSGTAPMDVKDLQAAFPPVIASVTSLSVTVDGANVTRTLAKLVQSPPFELAFPAQNTFGPAACNASNPPPNYPLPAGIYSPVVAEGYFVWLPPLPPGGHTISFTGASAATNVFGANVQNVAYSITVVPVSLK